VDVTTVHTILDRPSAPAVREVGGRLVERAAAGSAHARFESLGRTSVGRIEWRFRQPLAALLWWRSGVRELRLDIDGVAFHDVVTATSSLCYIPARATVAGSFQVEPLCRYTVLFLEPELAAAHGLSVPRRPLIGFDQPAVTRVLRDLAHEADHLDDTFDLFVDGGARQTLAHLVRLARADPLPPLSPAWFARLDAHVRHHLGEPITVEQLAGLAGFSTRHFLRAFRRGTGQTPMRWVLGLRLREAEHWLEHTDAPVTSIAATCGFSHVQHLSTAFRRAHGVSPSQYRRAHR
jgi:AraC family transcriptional regulator